MEQPNLNYLDELAGDDEGFRKQFIDILKRELPEEVAEYESFIAIKDYREAALMVHKIKHKVNVLGLEDSYIDSKNHENELNENDVKSVEKFREILRTMQTFLDAQ